jgi:hypothetical protein
MRRLPGKPMHSPSPAEGLRILSVMGAPAQVVVGRTADAAVAGLKPQKQRRLTTTRRTRQVVFFSRRCMLLVPTAERVGPCDLTTHGGLVT